MSEYDDKNIAYNEASDRATYHAEDIEYMIDTGIYVECPGCGRGITIARAVESGCYDHKCGRDPWNINIVQE